MTTYKFKTDIKCGGCLDKVRPHLNEKEEINHWEVDLTDPARVLTVEGDNISVEEVADTVKKAGFKADLIA